MKIFKSLAVVCYCLPSLAFAQGGTILSPGSNVGQFEKIEFGVDLPSATQSSVNLFFGNDPQGNYGYGNAYNPAGLNPYDPDKISVEAIFKYPGDPDRVINAFYYRDYEYKYTDPATGITSVKTEDQVNALSDIEKGKVKWVEKIISTHWRVRFAPAKTGSWQVTFQYRLNNGSAVPFGSTVSFSCIASANKGFVKFGNNGKFMTFSKNNDPAVFLGVSEGWPKPGNYPDGSMRAKEYLEHRGVIKKIALGGGNYTKIVFNPYSYAPEWEKLCVYDASPTNPMNSNNPYGRNRQTYMWELDKILDMAKDNSLYIHLCVEMGEGYFNNYEFSWVNNPYKTGGLAGVDYMNDFFDLAKPAVNVYKKRMRYIIARWGYSTNITDYEIWNEMHTMAGGVTMSDYYKYIDPNPPLGMQDPDHITKNKRAGQLFTPWYQEISNYMRSLDKDHLISAGYDFFNAWDLDGSWGIVSLPNINFLNRHCYAWTRNKAYVIWNDHDFAKNVSRGGYGKPVLISEFGHSLMGCGDVVDKNIDSPEFHIGLWASAFSGASTPGLEWWDRGLDNYLPHIPGIKSYFAGIDLDGGNFISRRYTAGGPADYDLLESHMLLNNNGSNSTVVLGWAHNKTYYWGNLIDPPAQGGCTNYYSSSLDAMVDAEPTCSDVFAKTPPEDIDSYKCPLEGVLGSIPVSGVLPNTTFALEWYNTTTNVMVRSEQVTSTSGGAFNITPPAFVKGSQDYSYKIRVYNGNYCNSNDALAVANTGDASGKQSLLLNNRCDQSNGAFRTINMSSNASTIVWHGAGRFAGWLDAADRIFTGNITGDSKDEIILVNTSYTDGAIESIDITTGNTQTFKLHGDFSGWMDATDKMFCEDIDNDGKKELILVNTGMSGGAVRIVDILTGADKYPVILHGSYAGMMDASDKMFLADIDGNHTKELVLVNTSMTGMAVMAIKLSNGATIKNVNQNPGFSGWMDATDRMFMGDVNGDSKEDLVLMNTAYGGGAIRVLDISDLSNQDAGTLWWINHNNPTSQFQYWMENNDKIFLEDMNGDNRKDLVFANCNDYTHASLRAYNINTQADIGVMSGGSYTGWLDCNDRILIGDFTGSSNNDIILVNSDYNYGAFLICNISTSPNSPVVKYHTDYSPSLTTWKDGTDVNSFNCSPKPTDVAIVESGRDISVYPNPSSGIINLIGVKAGMQVNVYNSLGANVISQLTNDQLTQLDADHLQNGIYFIEISDGKTVSHSKIVIEK